MHTPTGVFLNSVAALLQMMPSLSNQPLAHFILLIWFLFPSKNVICRSELCFRPCAFDEQSVPAGYTKHILQGAWSEVGNLCLWVLCLHSWVSLGRDECFSLRCLRHANLGPTKVWHVSNKVPFTIRLQGSFVCKDLPSWRAVRMTFTVLKIITPFFWGCCLQ